MTYKHLTLIVMLVQCYGFSKLRAQSSINSTGGDISGTLGSTSYSIGQMVFKTHKSYNGSINEGVHHSYESSISKKKDPKVNITSFVVVYPNPTKTDSYLIFNTNKIDITDLSYQLFDLRGNLLLNEKISNEKTKIALHNFASGIFILKVIQDNKDIKTFKIIKI